ncbi:MAG TPA: LamG domain-containing protein [Bryobacteraceae bacterium]|nr:LamG domain-containing protein [Bryobacteraceae bacterium]
MGFATPQWVQGQLGRALEFDGAGTNVVVIPNAPALNPAGQITLSAWIYSYTVGSEHPETIVSKAVGEDTQYSLAIERGGVIRFTLGASSLSTTTKIAPNSWTHVLASFDGETMRMYFNGQADPNVLGHSAPIAATEGEVLIGSTANADEPDTFNGLIDEVRIYWLGLNFASVTNLFNQGIHSSNGQIERRISTVNYGDQYSVNSGAASYVGPEVVSWWRAWQASIETGPFPPGSLWAAACKAPIDVTGKLLTCFLQRNPNIAGAILWRQAGSQPQTETDLTWSQWDAQSKKDLAEAFYYAFEWMNGGIQSFNGYNLVDPPVNQFTQPDAAPAITEFDPQAAWNLYVNTIAQSLAVEIGGFVPWTITGYSTSELQTLFDSNNVVSLQMASSNVLDPSIPQVWGYVPAGYTMDAPPTTYFQFLVANNIIQGNHKATINALINWSRYNLIHILNWTDVSALTFQGWWNYRGSSPGSRVLSGTLGDFTEPLPPYPQLIPHNWVDGCHGVVTLYRGLLHTVNIPTDYVIEFGHGMPIWWTVSESLSHGDDVESQILIKNGSEENQPSTWETWPIYAPANQFPISLTDFNNWFVGPNSSSLNVGRQAYEMWTIHYPDADLLTMYCYDKAHGLSPANGTVLASLQGSGLIALFPLPTLESMGFWNTLASESAEFGFCGP